MIRTPAARCLLDLTEKLHPVDFNNLIVFKKCFLFTPPVHAIVDKGKFTRLHC